MDQIIKIFVNFYIDKFLSENDKEFHSSNQLLSKSFLISNYKDIGYLIRNFKWSWI